MAQSNRPERQSAFSEKEQELVNTIRKSGVIDFERMGQVVAEVTPQLFDPGVVEDGDRIIKAVESVFHVWKLRPDFVGLEQVESLKTMAKEVRGQE